MNIMVYKGYSGRVELDHDKDRFIGFVEGIEEVIDFEGGNLAEAEHDFHCAINSYIAACEKRGKKPSQTTCYRASV